MTLRFQFEPFAQFIADPDALPSLEMHRQEVGMFQDLMTINLDHDMFAAGERLDQFRVVTARVGKKLVGYVWWWIYWSPKYQHVKFAEVDLHWLHPDHRLVLNGYRLLREAIKLIQEQYAPDVICMRDWVRTEHPQMMARLGFVRQDLCYMMRAKEA